MTIYSCGDVLSDCAFRLSAVEMDFPVLSSKSADSAFRQYLPPHILQYVEWGRVSSLFLFDFLSCFPSVVVVIEYIWTQICRFAVRTSLASSQFYFYKRLS